MKKLLNRVVICFSLVALVYAWALIADRQKLEQELIRLHVVAASDSEEDQAVKLRVRDAVLESLSRGLGEVTDVEGARDYIRENLPRLEAAANEALAAAGISDLATVKLRTEEFAARVYDTFSLPAGVYDTLRVTIGEGAGHNWWCVAFPSLCLPATTEGFEAVAAGAGFSRDLTDTLTGEYEVRFLLLDLVGQIENFLHKE